MISVFISHSHEDVELVKRLIALLRSALNILPARFVRLRWMVTDFPAAQIRMSNFGLRSKAQES